MSDWVGPAGLADLASRGIASPAPQSFRLSWQGRDFGAAQIARVTARAVEVGRGADAAGPQMWCGFVQSGELVVPVAAGVRTVGARGLLFVPEWQPHRVSIHGDAVLVALRVRRQALEGMVPAFPTEPHIVAWRPGLIAGVEGFAQTLLDAPPGTSAVEAYATSQLLVEMLGALMLDAFGVGSYSRSAHVASLRDRALAAIAQLCADPDLDVSDVARRVQISSRRLQAVFANAGTTVSAEIRRQRTALAVSMLRAPGFDVLSITEIAQHSGFGSVASMRRAILAAHGVSPRGIRIGREP